MTDPTALRGGGILAVVVLYKILPADSPSLRTLLAAASALPTGSLRLAIELADNTPGGQQVDSLPDAVAYRAYPENPGLTVPYNDALLKAERDGFHWILTLDQDTSLPVNFLSRMMEAVSVYGADPEVAAVVPRIVDGERTISPFRFKAGFWPSLLPVDVCGVPGRHVSALNSASLLRVSTLRQLGGYDNAFPLHNSDTRLYQLLDQAGKRVAVAGDIVVPHELSILDRERRMSPERYQQMLRDERTFWDRHMSAAGRAERLLRLAVRFGLGLLRGESAPFQKVTRDELVYRLCTRRATRMRKSSAHKDDA